MVICQFMKYRPLSPKSLEGLLLHPLLHLRQLALIKFMTFSSPASSFFTTPFCNAVRETEPDCTACTQQDDFPLKWVWFQSKILSVCLTFGIIKCLRKLWPYVSVQARVCTQVCSLLCSDTVEGGGKAAADKTDEDSDSESVLHYTSQALSELVVPSCPSVPCHTPSPWVEKIPWATYTILFHFFDLEKCVHKTVTLPPHELSKDSSLQELSNELQYVNIGSTTRIPVPSGPLILLLAMSQISKKMFQYREYHIARSPVQQCSCLLRHGSSSWGVASVNMYISPNQPLSQILEFSLKVVHPLHVSSGWASSRLFSLGGSVTKLFISGP